jgi:hypothetical protein
MVAAAAEEVQRLGYTPVTDPPRVLMDLAGQSVGLKDALGAQVAALSADRLVHTDADGREFVAALLASYATALKDASSAVGQLVKLGVGDLMADRERKLADSVYSAVESAIYSHEVDLSEEQVEAFKARFVVEWQKARPADEETNEDEDTGGNS